MGRNLSADLVFGVVLDEEDEERLPWGLEEHEEAGIYDLEDWWAIVVGGISEDDLPNYPDDTDRSSEAEEIKIAYRKLQERQREYREERPCPIEVRYFGVEDYSLPCLVVAGCSVSTLGPSGQIDLDQIPIPTAEQVSAAEALCKEHGIPWENPEWHLLASYG